MNIIINIAIFLISAVIFSFVGYTMRKRIAESKIRVAEEEAKRIIDSAAKEAENKRRKKLSKLKKK